MKNIQQEEALKYFEAHAQDWQKKAKLTEENQVNVIKQRNEYVLSVIKERNETKSFLDIGCGTGDLVCDVAKMGINAIGVDFAKEMIDVAESNINEEKIENAHFECCSIFDFDFSKQKFDVISANGFVEYITQEELVDFFNSVYDALTPNGSFVVGSRNRLFNIFSLNAYTQQEISESAISGLLEEAIALATEESLEEISKRTPIPLERKDLKHANTGIGVSTRYQYTPIQLISLLKQKGFTAVEIYPIHIHCMPPIFARNHQDIHGLFSNTLQKIGRQSRELIPISSSFMLHVKRGEEK